jgi:hypothetical protein
MLLSMAAHFDDLFAFETAVCHLRVFGGDAAPIALAMELDDNPGPSVVNAAEALTRRIAQAFGGGCRLFAIFPGPDATWTEILEEPKSKRTTFRSHVNHAEVERLAGEAVTLPHPGTCTAATLGGSRHPLLGLIPPEEELPSMLDEMQVVAVADLPWPHNPSKCAHIDRFNAVRGFYDKSFAGHIPAGAHFFLSLDADCFTACAYHEHDWLAIAAASVDLLTGLPPGSDRDDVLSAAADLLPAGPDRLELGFLFSDPITWSPSTTSITNGQHRTCALKASGATLCAALTYGERDYVAAPGDARRRAQSILGTYWVGKLGRDSDGPP